ncbi:LacI family transcriptional regulator [Herbiconiux sp. CPCC 205716]|uniref:LacI family transcriptional regulator n=1 Tax=Herbiconiux gentiana TaxID=2970912 RepID=A0ABT2GJQ6_9MICO|nr:LacI family DNA-binding transcriptional regulator [Herbiconiux gentiana]MCS5716456.1 LacI family transcriptional regulator [Herbiconiux gentiana]
MADAFSGTAPQLIDVARRAGVSASTASKALNAKADVNPATRQRVESAARELGYVPNAIARGLTGGRTGTVGVLTSDLEGRFALPILMGVEDALGIDRVLTFLCDARGDEAREKRLVDELVSRRVDGIIVVGKQTDPRPPIGRNLPVPVIYAYCMSDDPADLSISVDNAQAGFVAAQHLVDSGRSKIAHISGEAPHSASQRRTEGVQKLLANRGLELVQPPMYGDWSEGWGRAAAAILVQSGKEFDAILCGSDQIARGVLDSLLERGIAVPSDVAVMGIDNWVVLAENSRPALSTVDLQLQKLGRVAATRLFEASNGSKAAGVEYLPGSIVIRDSTIPRL